ncbi:MAG: HD domain-containing protein [Candidatus Paceibacterota bacterium]|jgi:HD-GYP domain-containing protein (c-di-GMP phosphodiesterase class II)
MNDLEKQFISVCAEVGISEDDQHTMVSFLSPLRDKNSVTHEHYLHSLRVGLLSRNIAKFLHLDEKALLMSGALHDLGKCQVCINTLKKIKGWNAVDRKEIQKHVMSGYRLLRGRFDLSADTMVRHHTFQPDGYPKKLPKFLHPYSATTKKLIVKYASLVALADVYDALHRKNDKFGKERELSGEEIRSIMIEINSDMVKLISDLYDEKIFCC